MQPEPLYARICEIISTEHASNHETISRVALQLQGEPSESRVTTSQARNITRSVMFTGSDY